MPQEYRDLANVLEPDLFQYLYKSWIDQSEVSMGAPAGPLFTDNPDWTVGLVLEGLLSERGYSIDDVRDLVGKARADGSPVTFDLNDLLSDERRDLDYWPEIDLDPAWAEITEFWKGVNEEAGGSRYYPGWLIRRQVALTVIQAAINSASEGLPAEMYSALDELAVDADDPYEEDEQLDERLATFLSRFHLAEIADAFVSSLTVG